MMHIMAKGILDKMVHIVAKRPRRSKIATLIEIADQCFEFYDKELKWWETALEETNKELARRQEKLKEATEGQSIWKDRYNGE
ncbi:UNVERIFIED_CONTAM: hypothetical protein Sindi_0138600, partial [Sesamum indicum]